MPGWPAVPVVPVCPGRKGSQDAGLSVLKLGKFWAHWEELVNFFSAHKQRPMSDRDREEKLLQSTPLGSV